MTLTAILRNSDGLTTLRLNLSDGETWIESPLRPSEPNRRLLAAWDALGSVHQPDKNVLFSVLVVLLETVVGRFETCSPLLFDGLTPTRRPAPTAAHPRAYQGTIIKPPKAKVPPSLNLRPALCDPAAQRELLARLRPFWPGALARLARAGYDVSALRDLPDDGDPYAAVHHGWGGPREDNAFPDTFRRCLYPLLRGLPWPDVRDYAVLFGRLGLDKQPVLLAQIARLVEAESGANTRGWCRVMTAQPDEWRATFARLLRETEGFQADAASLTDRDLAMLADIPRGPNPESRLPTFFRALRDGANRDYLRVGFSLADELYPDGEFGTIGGSGTVSEETVRALMAHLSSADSFYPRLALQVWKDCGERAGLGEVLQSIHWTRYSPDVALQLLNALLACRSSAWPLLRGQIGEIEILLAEVPSDYHAKCLAHLDEFFWEWDNAKIAAAALPSAFALLRRLARPPFLRSAHAADPLSDFLGNLPPAPRARFCDAPDASFRKLEQTCRLKNTAFLVGRGTWVLTRLVPEFSVNGFLETPARLCRVAKRLGCLSKPMRERIVRETENGDGEDAKARLTRLETDTLRALTDGFDADAGQANVRHALQLYRLAGENRPALRRFLKSDKNGWTKYAQAHPRAIEWRKRHPALNMEIWQSGVPFVRTLETGGEVKISVETDPLEALRLGTYAGSCLGLGGDFAYSAVAAALDINKRVVYARDTRGVVLARQLLAVSEDDRLVCFSVYPLSAGPELETMFRAFDAEFSDALGLPLLTGDDDYVIQTILAQSWWDDGVWEKQNQHEN